jgi:hypothetical protein
MSKLSQLWVELYSRLNHEKFLIKHTIFNKFDAKPHFKKMGQGQLFRAY